MLNLDSTNSCDGARLSRRNCLQIGTLAGLGLALPDLLASKQAAAGTKGDDINCIVIWTQGGTSHHDTVDPKPDAAASVKGEFGVIDTATPGIQFTEVFYFGHHMKFVFIFQLVLFLVSMYPYVRHVHFWMFSVCPDLA